MLKAWRKVFEQAERRPTVEPSEDLLLGEAIATATLEPPGATRTRHAVAQRARPGERDRRSRPAAAASARDQHDAGVGTKTRKEITAVTRRLAARFPDVRPVVTQTPAEPKAGKPAAKKRGGKPQPKQPRRPPPIEALRRSLDLLADTLVPQAKRQASAQEQVLRPSWALTRARRRPRQASGPARLTSLSRRRSPVPVSARSSASPHALGRRGGARRAGAEIAEILPLRGGVMTATELAGALLTTTAPSTLSPCAPGSPRPWPGPSSRRRRLRRSRALASGGRETGCSWPGARRSPTTPDDSPRWPTGLLRRTRCPLRRVCRRPCNGSGRRGRRASACNPPCSPGRRGVAEGCCLQPDGALSPWPRGRQGAEAGARRHRGRSDLTPAEIGSASWVATRRHAAPERPALDTLLRQRPSTSSGTKRPAPIAAHRRPRSPASPVAAALPNDLFARHRGHARGGRGSAVPGEAAACLRARRLPGPHR